MHGLICICKSTRGAQGHSRQGEQVWGVATMNMHWQGNLHMTALFMD